MKKTAKKTSNATKSTVIFGWDRNFVIVSGVAIILVIGLILTSVFLGGDNEEPDPAPEPTPTETVEADPDEDEAPVGDSLMENPLLEFAEEELPDVDADESVTVEVDGNTLSPTLSTSGSLTVASQLNATWAVDECTVSASTDLCFLGQISYGALTYDVSYLRDVKTTRMFRANESDVTEVEVPGAASAATIPLQYGSTTRTVLAIANSDSTGYMIVLPPNAEEATLNDLLSNIEIG